MTVEEKRAHIIEICSEDETPSSNFWSGITKTEAEAHCIVESISQLVQEGKLITLKQEWMSTMPAVEIPFDRERLAYEVRNSIQLDHDNYDAIKDSYLVFYATAAGKEEDKQNYWKKRLLQIAEEDKLSLCRICKHDLGESVNDARAHYVICEVCGMQYGYMDTAGGSLEKRERIYLTWRKAWIDNDRKMLSKEQRIKAISEGMGFNPAARPLDIFKNLEGKLPQGDVYKSFPPATYQHRNDVTIPQENPALEDKPLYEFFTYTSQVEKEENSFIFTIPAGISSKEVLLNKYAEMMPSYFGKNWDALDETLHDLSWIKEGKVIIVHNDIPKLLPVDLQIYLKVLAEAVQLLNAGPRRDFILPYGTHKLKVIFPEYSRLTIQSLFI